MKFKKRELLLGVLLGTGLHLLNNLRDRLPDNMDDIKDRARRRYETASDRLGRLWLRGRGKARLPPLELAVVCHPSHLQRPMLISGKVPPNW